MKTNKSTKRAFLLSVCSIMLCLVMLIGSTFAWFTDTASTGVNKIQAGNLDIEVEYRTSSEEDWKILDNATDLFGAAGTLFEPGHTRVVELRITNAGNLALKYKIGMNVVSETAGTNKAGNPYNLSDYLKVAATGIQQYDPTDQISSLMEQLIFQKGDFGMWTARDFANFELEYTSNGNVHALQPGAAQILGIKVYMPETVGNEANAKTPDDAASISFGLNILATQHTTESDSYGTQYDKDAPLDFVPVSTAAELKAVFANAAAGEAVNVSLTGDIDLGADKTLMIVDENSAIGDINIQANGHTIKNAVTGARVLQIAKSDTARTITISGAKIVSEGAVTSNENRGVQIFSVDHATVNLVNCEIEMKANDYSYPVKIGGTSKNTTVNITGCTLTGANCIESFGTSCTVNITDCVLNSNYAPNAAYCGNGIQDKNGTNNTYNIKNTTFNGTNAQPWQTSSTTVINDLGGNVYNTTRTTE